MWRADTAPPAATLAPPAGNANGPCVARAHGDLGRLNNAWSLVKQMGSSCDVLCAYLCDTHDAKGVVDYIREKWPKSLSSYLSAVKKQWLTMGEENATLPAQFDAAFAAVDAAIVKKIAQGTEGDTAFSEGEATPIQRHVSHEQVCASTYTEVQAILGLPTCRRSDRWNDPVP